MNEIGSIKAPVVVIADLVRSRDLPDRDAFQQRLLGHLEEISAREGVLSPYTLTLGDEFQAVLTDFAGGLRDGFDLLARLAPVKVRFALAAGPLSTRIHPVAALQMDGPAFIEARRVLEALKRRRHTVLQIGWALPGPGPDLANAALVHLAGVMDGWKPATHHIFQHLLDELPAEESARRLGMTVRGVHKHIAGHHLHDARSLLRRVMEDLERRRQQAREAL